MHNLKSKISMGNESINFDIYGMNPNGESNFLGKASVDIEEYHD